MRYSVAEIDEDFVNKVITEIKDRYKNFKTILEYFDENAEIQFSSVTRYDPVRKRECNYEFPLAYDIYMLYYFLTGGINKEQEGYEINDSLKKIENLFFHNPLFSSIKYNIRQDSFQNTRLGFLYHLSNLKRRLLQKDTFTARELAMMSNYTNQGMISKIHGPNPIEPKKEGGRYVLSNRTAREIVKESQSPILT